MVITWTVFDVFLMLARFQGSDLFNLQKMAPYLLLLFWLEVAIRIFWEPNDSLSVDFIHFWNKILPSRVEPLRENAAIFPVERRKRR